MQRLLVILIGAALGLGANWGFAEPQNSGAQKPGPESVETLIQRLGDKEDNVRFEAAWELSKRGPQAKPAVGSLTKLLKDPNPNVRVAASQALRSLGPAAKETIPALVEGLADTDMTDSGFPVWVPVSVALGAMGPEAVPPLVGLLKKSDRQLQQAAANAIGNLGPAAKEAVDPLVAILEKNDPETRTAMMVGLIGIGPEAKAAVPALIKMLDSDDFHTQYWSQRALAKIGPAARPAVPKLIELLSKGVVSVRRHSAIALGDIGPGIGQEGLDALAQALGDKTEPVRADAVVALGKLGDFARPAVPSIRKAIQERRIAAVVPAANSLWLLTHDAEVVVPVLAEALRNPQDPDGAIAAAQLLGQLGPAAQKAVPALSVAVLKGEPELRAEALKAIDKIAPKEKK